MFLDVKHAFPDIVRDCVVLRFRETRSTYQFVATIKLRDDTELHVKDYLFADGSHKYAYHWQCRDGSLIARWDNAPHWPNVGSHPHHVHRGDVESVEMTTVRSLYDAMVEIQSFLVRGSQ